MVLMPFSLCADGLYFDAGINMHSNYYDTSNHPKNKSTVRMQNPLGTVAVGYCKQNWCGYYEHISSITDKYDNGLNMIGVRYRLFGD